MGENARPEDDPDLLFIEEEVDRWMHAPVKDGLFVPSDSILADGIEYLRFRDEHQVRALGRGELTVEMSDVLFRSALRDEEPERARKNFLVGNKIASQTGSSAVEQSDQQVRGVKRALGMARMSKSTRITRDLVALVERLTVNAKGDDLIRLRSRAWVELLSRLGDDQTVSTREWNEACSQVPSELQDNRGILTTQLQFHTQRYLADSAWQCWQRLVDTKQLDSTVVMLGTKLKATESGAEEAIAFVDDWAKQPGQRDRMDDTQRIRIDVITVNVLLSFARYEPRPDLTTWLWQNMSRRWGVDPDDNSLTRLIRGIDKAYLKSNAQAQNTWAQYSRLQVIRPISERFTVERNYEWQDVAGIFRDTALRTYPSLQSVTSPLKEGRIISAFQKLVASGHLPSVPVDEQHAHVLSRPPPPRTLPADPPFSNIRLSSSNFHAYIVMLLHQSLYDDAVLALGWMKRLSVYPDRATQIAVLRTLADNGQPKDVRFLKEREGWGRYRLMAPDEWLLHWLEQWLGPSRIPSEDEVAESVRDNLERGGRTVE